MFNLGRLSRSPPRHQPRDPLQNDERPLPIGWNRAFSNNVDPGRLYYSNGRQSQWNFPNEADAQTFELEQADEQEDSEIGGNLRENLALISNNNNFNQLNMDVLSALRRMITEDNEQTINRLTIGRYMMDLEGLIYLLRDREVHYVLKHLCEQIFEEIYEKLAKEKQIIDFGYTSHNERDTTYLNEQLNGLNSIYIRFRNIINNI